MALRHCPGLTSDRYHQNKEKMKTQHHHVFAFALVCVLMSLQRVLGMAKPKKTVISATPHRRGHIVGFRPRMSPYERFLQSVFDKADVDNDGKMSLTETYEWVLRFYVQINRNAPINPPTLHQVQRLIRVMDTDGNNSINRTEFRALAEILWQRAAARVAAHKFVTMIVAPLFAEAVLQWFQHQTWLYEKYVVRYVPRRLVPIVTNTVLGRTVLIVLWMSTLGNFIMEAVNDYLDERIEKREAEEEAAERELKNKGRRRQK